VNHGPLIFLGVLAALAASWFGVIVQPQLQLGRAVPGTNMVNATALYPQARSGLAQQGLQVYRSLGCATCHTRQVRQDGMLVDVVLREAGTNTTDLIEAILRVKRDLSGTDAENLLNNLPIPIRSGLIDPEAAAAVVKELTDAGAKAQLMLRPQGSDIDRGWGRGRTVAADFLQDQPALPGKVRLGPDLANIGSRMPSPEWHYRHLYHPVSCLNDARRGAAFRPTR
jgi:ribosomal protein L7/L12